MLEPETLELEPDPCGLETVVCPAEAMTPPKPVYVASTSTGGKATWYAKGLKNPYTQATAASRDYPRGSRLLVTNTANGKSIEVLVNDYGPQAWTGKAIDLSYYAFAQLEDPSRGVINVKIEKI